MLVVVLLVAGVVIYARWRFDQIHKASVAGLSARVGDEPFNVLLVGSDSRAFVDNSAQASQFGSSSSVSGQRSDVIIIARVDPATHAVKLLSIPRDTYVDIPGNIANISGPNRINAAFNSGPSLLVKTIKQSFHIPINDYAEINFAGFSGMVNALGGIWLDFAYPVRDAYSGLSINHSGCQLVMGAQALALVRSRHLYYYENGQWNEDYGSDWSRIQRQDAFFRAMIPKLHGLVGSPSGVNSFLGAATKNITIDQTLTESALYNLAQDFRGAGQAALSTETLPTIPYTTAAGADVLLPATGPDAAMIKQFMSFGASATTDAVTVGTQPAALAFDVLTSAPTVTTVPVSDPPSSSDVVYNNQPEPWNPTPCTPK